MARRLLWGVAMVAVLAACAPRTDEAVEAPQPEFVVTDPAPATATRGAFTIEAEELDTWNAVGQIVVRTPGVEYEGRSQMLDLYTVRYRGVPFLLITRAMLLSDTIKRTTTQVTATTRAGKPIDHDAVVELLELLQRELPAEIADVRRRQAEEAKAKKDAEKKKKKKKK
jgi:hypothetical protein